ncbi:hypothetical protein AeMF1_017856, partial [Aphanomyces euteiches]
MQSNASCSVDEKTTTLGSISERLSLDASIGFILQFTLHHHAYLASRCHCNNLCSCLAPRPTDRPTDSIAVEDAVYAARADQINRMLVQKHTVELSQKEKSGIKYGRWGGKAVGGGAGMAVGTLTGIAVGTMAGGPVGAVAGATAGGVAGRLGGELAGKKFLPRLGAKVGRFFANRDAAKGPQILKTLTERNPELKAISDKGSRISRNKPIPLMQRIIRSNSAASSVSYEKGPEPKW